MTAIGHTFAYAVYALTGTVGGGSDIQVYVEGDVSAIAYTSTAIGVNANTIRANNDSVTVGGNVTAYSKYGRATGVEIRAPMTPL